MVPTIPNVGVFSLHQPEILQHQSGVLQCKSILSSSTWRQCQIPQVKGSAPQECLCFRCQVQVQIVICAINQSSLRLISLLERRTELRGIVHLLDHQFIIKGYDPGTARWEEMHRARYEKRERGIHDPSELTTPFKSTWTPAQKLSEPYPFGFL